MLKKQKFKITRNNKSTLSEAVADAQDSEKTIFDEDTLPELEMNELSQFDLIDSEEDEVDAEALLNNMPELAEDTLTIDTPLDDADGEDAINQFSNGYDVASETSHIKLVEEATKATLNDGVDHSISLEEDASLTVDEDGVAAELIATDTSTEEANVGLFVGPIPLLRNAMSARDEAIEVDHIDPIKNFSENDHSTDSASVDQESEAIINEPEVISEDKPIATTQPSVSKIGRILYDLGKITRADMKKVLRVQKKHGLLFGDAALKLGLIKDADIQKVVAMQFNYHYLQAGQGEFSDDLVAAYAPFSKKVEAYRALRSQLMMRWFKKGQRSLAVVSANGREGISYLTANLGVVFSQLGARTLVIEANMRTPRQQTIFNIKETAGLSDILVGRAGVESINEIDSIPDLSVLTAGTVPPNPQELLGRTSFNLLLKTLYELYDVILIDTPPAIESADAQSAIELAEGALIVSRINQTKQSDILQLRHQIEMTGAAVVGAVLNEY